MRSKEGRVREAAEGEPRAAPWAEGGEGPRKADGDETDRQEPDARAS